jgi:hypothetical protein
LLFNLVPAINGYDPLHLAKSREIISGEGQRSKEYHRIVEAREAADNIRVSLLLKRPFWLTREFVRGPLPGKSALFPPASTVFLEQPPAGLALPEKKREKSAASVPEDFVKVDFADKKNLQLPVSGNRPVPITLTYRLPRRMHAALRLHYRSTGPGRIDTHFSEDRQPEVAGRSVAVVNTGASQAMVEIPAPDFLNPSVQLRITMKGGTLDFTDGFVACDGTDEDDLIHIKSWTPNKAQVQIDELPGPRVLVFTDAAYPGWRVWVDGQPAQVMLADDGFKAVALTSGKHTIQFAFSSRRVTAGVAVSVTALIAAAALLRLLRRKATVSAAR